VRISLRTFLPVGVIQPETSWPPLGADATLLGFAEGMGETVRFGEIVGSILSASPGELAI
jgi:hypothetical protein